MSFLSKLFRKHRKSAVEETKSSAPAPVEEPVMDIQENPITDEEPTASKYKNNNCFDDQYFAELLNEENFPGYTVERNVHPSLFDESAHKKCYPVTFLFKKDSTPVLAVMVMKMNQRTAMIARGTYWILEDKGIPYLRFYREMLNEKEYVLERVRDQLEAYN